ncbi:MULTISPECIES: bifunctional nuclease family protein [unclassified Arthrobacter]|jgi:bifunctional DNase/RNase|uniref:bifunctional nuclease family protein n=1 Tax=unclassified Arthrobacter TaxID=235627 RepID=UPI001C85F7A6|nr:bifunctional nuclease family protein [Arthrobacter sp. MAHUQ-56]MBX7446162.1 bifunctional nuclease family protein [Arthrobacter sp. MAHUQ-56]
MIEVEIVGVRIELPSNQPLVLLKEMHGERHVPIWIGTPEASAIALAQQGVVPPRPMTHDLLVDVVESLGHSVVSVNIVAVEDNIFYGQLQFENGTTVSSRASDALAIALRAKCRIWCADAVMDEAGVRITEHDEGEDAEPGPTVDEERELRRFREFLDDVEPEDFDG